MTTDTDTTTTDSLVINEIFFSIQGESTHVGRPCVFVRLTGCNLRCRWCDTEYAFYEGARTSVSDVVDRVCAYGCDLVEITGGEPLLQKPVYPLIDTLLARGKQVMIETSGSLDISDLDPRVIRIMDLKCPGSGECEKNLWSNLDYLTSRDELKFVIRDRADYEWARDTIRARKLDARVGAVLISCVHSELDPAQVASWILDDKLPARLQIQLHKVLWPGVERGV